MKSTVQTFGPAVLTVALAAGTVLFFNRHMDKPPPQKPTLNFVSPRIMPSDSLPNKWVEGPGWEAKQIQPKDTASAVAEAKFKDATLKAVRTRMVKEGFDAAWIDSLLCDARIGKPELPAPKPDPADTSKPEKIDTYGKYKEKFKIDSLALRSSNFYLAHREAMDSLAEKHNTPRELGLSILGIESIYGDSTGWRSAVNVFLNAVEKGKRRNFALREFAALLRLCEKYNHDPLEVAGSTWGAISPAQAIPTMLERFDKRYPVASFEELVSVENSILFVFDYLGLSGASMREGFVKNGRNYKAAYEYNHSDWYAAMAMELALLIRKELQGIEPSVTAAAP